ncbi:glycosyl transferase [Cnuibacter physcomitrellae]|uniref:Glycosyl transferase n=1 Tax=Cnuibacter physcomitrellae TaxID=1619308 RepID=A0A1X9LPH6_9MICO|nr:glycosyltransferase family 9 protein [Cnuibacter physcomitrellae]ARJ06352.1 glycosyl transferase [Cnuibacter physcomitrellae]GGI37806.1 glycosyl transferase [Cnuibacter physcomitrellae]
MTRRALVARLDSVGDVLLCGPAIRAIAASDEVDEVWLLCSAVGAPAARLLPGVDRVLVWDCPWITASTPAATPETMADLRSLLAEARPDVAVILTSFHQSPLPLALELRLAGVRRIAGASVDFAGSLLDVRLKPGEDFPEDQPEPVRALTLARAAGFDLPPGDDGELRMRTDPRGEELFRAPDPFVVVHPGASASARRWPAEHHRELVRLLAEDGVRCVVTGGSGERELTARVAGRDGVDLGGDTDLGVLADVVRRAAVLVCGNTGPAHLAAAVGTPVVSLFSPVVPPERWAPYGVPHVLLGDQHAACRGTRATECPVPGHPCLTSVTPAAVREAVLALAPALSERRTRERSGV